jgi:hypothetical protein
MAGLAASISRIQETTNSTFDRLALGSSIQNTRDLGYPWESDRGQQDAVRLFDALGRTVLIPLLFMQLPEVRIAHGNANGITSTNKREDLSQLA